MVDMLAITTTPDLLAEMIMKCPDLRCAVKRIILRDIDEQCQKLCTRSQEKSSVLRIPRSKHKVKYTSIIFLYKIWQLHNWCVYAIVWCINPILLKVLPLIFSCTCSSVVRQ